MAAVPALPVVGLNVTMPFKRAVLELCDEVAMAASMAGAVNTVQLVDGKLMGYNTDGRGLLEALDEGAGFTVAGKDVVLIGSGGAAGAAFVAFILAQAASVTVVSRNSDSAEDLLGRMAPHLGNVSAHAVGIGDAESSIRSAALVVNATPVGMAPSDGSVVPAGWVGPGQVVFDMVYGTPHPTPLVSESRAAGAVALDGLGMLVCQGATAVDIWNTGAQTRAPREVMRQAAEAELASRRVAGQG
jgi:shikimate dehydrogenase